MVDIPANIANLKLAGLVLDKNPDLNLATTFTKLAKIKTLMVLLLRNNQLKQLPNNLAVLRGLEVLELSGNNFSDIERSKIKTLLNTTNVVF